MKIRIASDVGGTFTDSIAYDSVSRRISVSKVPTTPQAREVGTVESLRRTLKELGAKGSAVDYVGHGMTTATNAVIQRSGAKTAFVTTRGFRDLLLIGRQDRPSLFDIDVVRTPPLVPRELCYGIGGRMDANGREIEPLDRANLTQAAADMCTQGVEAVAVVFLHAYANPAHEREAKAMLERELSGVVICISTDILREFREFERASTTVLNAFLTPIMTKYLGSLSARLRDREDGLGVGRDKPIMVMEASGGLMTVELALARPVHTVLSGPAGGVVAGAHFAGLVEADTIITMDIGGTSTDISLIRNGRPETTRNARIGQIPIRLPVIDINAIGAGGGSIAWIDDGGALRVGPMSAEAVPGPACYGQGGTRPTISDANLVLGRLGGETRLGGSLSLDADAARRAVQDHVAGPLGIDLVAAAAGILRVAHANIVRGIRVVSVERGHDPRLCTLVPFGGAGPMHGTPVARELRIGRVAIPPAPGILCALGQLLVGPASRPDRDAYLPLLRRCAGARHVDRAPPGRCRGPSARGRPGAGRQALGGGARRGALCGTELRAADCLRLSGRRRLAAARRRLPRGASRQIRPRRPRGAYRDRRLRRNGDRQGRYARVADACRREAPRRRRRRGSAPVGCSSRGAIPAMPATGP